jgi:hypothetical protein
MANPNPDTSGLAPKWKKGQSGNPGGKTKEQRKREVKAAELAAKLRLDMLQALAELTAGDQAMLVEAIKSDNLRLLKDTEDRAWGTPQQPVDHTSSDGSMKPTMIELVPGVLNESED